MTGPGPIDTIREALGSAMCGESGKQAALAALTEVEHQLEAGLPILSIDGRYVLTSKWAKEQARAVAAETALAEANQRIELLEIMDMTATATQWEGAFKNEKREREAAERRANDYADALRRIADNPTARPSLAKDQLVSLARAALDRHTHQDKAATAADCTCVYGTGVTPGCPYCERHVTLKPDTHTTREP